MSARDVVVTGLGAVTPLGADLEATFAAACAGRSAVRSDSAGRPVAPVDALPEPPAAWGEMRERWSGAGLLDRGAELLLGALAEAWRDAGEPDAQDRLSVCAGGACVPRGLMGALEERRGPGASPEERIAASRPGDWARTRPSHAASVAAGFLGARGPVRTFCMGAAGGLWAVDEAARLLEAGAAERVVCVVADSLVDPLVVAAFVAMGLVADGGEAACRPFDRRRAGIVPGEGAAALVLERAETARARGARIRGELRALGRAAPVGGPDSALRTGLAAMRQALGAAGVRPAFVHADASGGRGDSGVAEALAELLGDRLAEVPVTTLRGASGHLGTASALVEAALVLRALEGEVVPPVVGLEQPEVPGPDFVLSVQRPRPGARVAMQHVGALAGSHAAAVWGRQGVGT